MSNTSASAEIASLTATDLAALYRRRELSPVDAVRALLDRIEQRDPAVRAFITVTADHALRQARGAERAIAGGDARPLLGIPIALKDLIDTRGILTTAGSRALADNVPTRDAAVWRRLRRAGAVLLGKANTHEFAYGGTTAPTRNPWNLDRMVGGSSGGSAAAVAGGMAPLALGTDSAGSIRIPAGFCGIFGHKPTRGLVSRAGIFPLAPTLDIAGPIARTPRDAGLVLDAIAGRNREDPSTSAGRRPRTSFVPDAGRDATGLRIGLIADPGPLSPGVEAALRRATEALTDAGATVDEVSIGSMHAATETVFAVMGPEAAHHHAPLLRERGDLYSPYVRERIEAGFATTAVMYLDALAECERIAARCDDALSGHDLLLTAGMPCPAPVAYVEEIEVGGETLGRDFTVCRNTAFANASGHPALAVPAGFEDGLPVGVQIVASHHADALALQVGQILFERLVVGDGHAIAPADA